MKCQVDKIASLLKYKSIKWQVDTMTSRRKLQIAKTASWQDDKLNKFWVTKMESWTATRKKMQVGKALSWQKWQVAEMTSWLKYESPKWKVGTTTSRKNASWWSGELTKWQVAEMTNWLNCESPKWKVGTATSGKKHAGKVVSWQNDRAPI